MRERLRWTTQHFSHDRYRIPMGRLELAPSRFQLGLRVESRATLAIKSLGWPIVRARDDLLVDGFVQWMIGRWIREYADSDPAFLEVGCGDMTLRRYLPRGAWYNAIDISFSEYHLRRAVRGGGLVNVALASVTDIPLEVGVASLVVTSQVLEYVQEIGRAIDEIYRVSEPQAKLVVSIANGHCLKYQVKGPHRGHVNFWSQLEFVKMMTDHNFRLLASDMRGLWIPFPRCLTETSYQLPIPCRDEVLNSYMLFVFEAQK